MIAPHRQGWCAEMFTVQYSSLYSEGLRTLEGNTSAITATGTVLHTDTTLQQLFISAPSDFAGIIHGNRHYTGTTTLYTSKYNLDQLRHNGRYPYERAGCVHRAKSGGHSRANDIIIMIIIIIP